MPADDGFQLDDERISPWDHNFTHHIRKRPFILRLRQQLAVLRRIGPTPTVGLRPLTRVNIGSFA